MTGGATASSMPIPLRVNGQDHALDVPTHHTLLEVLRDQLKLIGVREGCGIGMCGACTVLMDGRPISSCLTLGAMAEGHDILTIEGLSLLDGFAPIPATVDGSEDLAVREPGPLPEGGTGPSQPALHPIQRAFVARTGFQCSFCTPGIILTTKALLDENPDASDEEIRSYLSGNLCRCGSYVKILDSVREAIAQLRAGR